MVRGLDGFGCIAAAALMAVASTTCTASAPGESTRAQADAGPDRESTDVLVGARALMREGRYAEARDSLDAALSERPDWAEAQVALALTYVKEQRWETARRLLERGLELDPGQHKARLPYAWCLYYLGELEEARSSVEAFLEQEPDYADAVYALALIEFDSDRLDASEKLLRRVIMLGRKHRDRAVQALAHARLADVYLRRGSPSRARLELNRSIELVPDDPKTHFKMSRVLRLLGDAEGAAEARHRYESLRSAAGDSRTEAPALP